MKSLFAAVGITFLSFSGSAEAKIYSLWNNRVHVDAPTGTRVGNLSGAKVIFLPKKGGFSANVNIMRQSYFGGIKNFAAISKRQFSQVGFRVLSQKFYYGYIWDVEYTGVVLNRSLRFYARAFQTPQGIVLVTATSLKSKWKSSSTDKLLGILGSVDVFY